MELTENAYIFYYGIPIVILFMFLMIMIPAISMLYVVCLVTIPPTYMPSVSTIYMMVFLALFLMLGMQRYNLFPQYERRYITLFERNPICKFMLNEHFKIQEANEQTLNYFGTAFIEGDFTSLMKESGNMPQIERLLTMLNETGEVIDELIAFNDVNTGKRAYLAVHAIRIEGDGEVFYYVMFRDCTIEVQQEERIRELAFYDSLTKLPNRAAFMETATKLFHEREESAIVLLDLNYFKRINDDYGHAAGDAILQAVSDVLRQVVQRPHMPARLGGDEFVIYVDASLLTAELPTDIAKLREALEDKVVHFNGQRLHISPSIGYCHKSTCDTFDLALQEADKMMYKDKEAVKRFRQAKER